MKKRVFLSLLLALMLVLPGCGDQPSNPANGGDKAQAGGEAKEQLVTPEQNGQSPKAREQDAEQQVPGAGDGITVVAKSEGAVSASEEKTAILDEIAKELDKILNSSNSLEQINDNDLDK